MTQLELFSSVLAPDKRHHIDALVCLRDAMPNALEHVVALQYQQPHDTRAPHKSGAWAYCACRAGIRYETVAEWGHGARLRGERSGWDRTPAHLITWDELAALVGADPRRAEIAAWVETLPEPRWRVLERPHELWPDPDGWHISYFCHDHVDHRWPARRRAWQLTLDLLNDAIDTVEARP